MAVLKVKSGDEWVPVAGGGGNTLDPEELEHLARNSVKEVVE